LRKERAKKSAEVVRKGSCKKGRKKLDRTLKTDGKKGRGKEAS
jgi:hypothetical protein